MTISLSQAVSVVLVLAVVYYIMSMLISGITKWVLDLLETRGKILEDFLKKSLVNALEKGKENNKEEIKRLEEEGNRKIEKLKNTPQINALRPVRAAFGLLGEIKVSDHVERIQPKVLVDALFDIGGTVNNWKEKVIKVINMLPDNFTNLGGNSTPFTTKETLIAMVDTDYYTFAQWREKLETYFGSVMDQATQKFTVIAKRYVLLFSIILAFVLGVDSIQIAGRAWFDPQLTQKADVYAETILQSEEANQGGKQEELKALYDTLEDMAVINLPWYVIGEDEDKDGEKDIINYPWYIQPPLEESSRYEDLVSPYTRWSLSMDYGYWLFLRILGLLLTGIAVSQGSTFWYDIIRQIKGEQKKVDTTSKEGSITPGVGAEPLTEETPLWAAPPPPGRPAAEPPKPSGE